LLRPLSSHPSTPPSFSSSPYPTPLPPPHNSFKTYAELKRIVPKLIGSKKIGCSCSKMFEIEEKKEKTKTINPKYITVGSKKNEWV